MRTEQAMETSIDALRSGKRDRAEAARDARVIAVGTGEPEDVKLIGDRLRALRGDAR